MARDYVKLYAPYVFLTKGLANEFDLFVCVPHQAGQRVVENTLSPEKMYSNGKTFLEFKIEGTGTGEAQDMRFFKRIPLDPARMAQNNGYTFDDRFCVEVTTKRQETVPLMQTIKVFYKDKDPDVLSAGQIAFDSPYLYLVNPNETTGEQNYEYAPYCLVPLKDFDQNAALDQKYSEDEATGKCQQEITLLPVSPAQPPVGNATDSNGVEAAELANYREVTVQNIQVNQEVYKDAQKTEGWFDVTVVCQTAGGPGKKRKGTLTNASSDPNPVSFIDSFF